jgi:hypothetical protein
MGVWVGHREIDRSDLECASRHSPYVWSATDAGAIEEDDGPADGIRSSTKGTDIMNITPIHPDDVESVETGPDERERTTRRTLGFRKPSRRTLAAMRRPSRRTLGRRTPSRRTLGRRTPSRRTLGARRGG